MLNPNKRKSTGTLIILKPVTRAKDGSEVKPYFRISNKETVDGKEKWVVSDDTSVSNVSGTLERIEITEESYDNKPYDKVSVLLRDGEEAYLLDMRFKISTRSLLNSLINLKEFDNIEIGYYNNTKGYDSYSVRQNGERVEWKYSMDQIPKPKEVVFNKIKQKDYSAVDDFYKKEVEEFAEVLKAASHNASREEAVEVGDDSVPF